MEDMSDETWTTGTHNLHQRPDRPLLTMDWVLYMTLSDWWGHYNNGYFRQHKLIFFPSSCSCKPAPLLSLLWPCLRDFNLGCLLFCWIVTKVCLFPTYNCSPHTYNKPTALKLLDSWAPSCNHSCLRIIVDQYLFVMDADVPDCRHWGWKHDAAGGS